MNIVEAIDKQLERLHCLYANEGTLSAEKYSELLLPLLSGLIKAIDAQLERLHSLYVNDNDFDVSEYKALVMPLEQALLELSSKSNIIPRMIEQD